MATFTDLLKTQKDTKDPAIGSLSSAIMALPDMAKDISIVRQGIVKLVKINEKQEKNQSSLFFQKAFQREKDYESRFNRMSKSKTPTPVKGAAGLSSDGIGGFLSGILNFLLKTFLVGGGIVGIGKILQDEELRNTIKDFLGKSLKGLFEGIGESFKLLGDVLTTPDVLTSIGKMFNDIFEMLKKVAEISLGEIETPFGDFNLKLGEAVGIIGGLIVALASLKTAIGIASTALLAFNALKPPGTPTSPIQPTREPPKTGPSSLGPAAGAASAAASAEAFRRTIKPSESTVKPSQKFGTNVKPGGLTIGGQQPQVKTKWGKFLKFVAKKSPKLFAMIGNRLAMAAGMASVPIVGWIASLLSLGFTLWTAWELYELWQEFSKESDQEIEQSKSPSPVTNPTSVTPRVPAVTSGASTTAGRSQQTDPGKVLGVTATPGAQATPKAPAVTSGASITAGRSQQTDPGEVLGVTATPGAQATPKAPAQKAPTPVPKLNSGGLMRTSMKSPTAINGINLLKKVLINEGITDNETAERIFRLASVESSMNPNATGPIITEGIHKGDQAHGLLQIMPKTAEEVGFSREDIKDPEKAALAGVRYFKKNLKEFNGNLDAATVAHHAGPGGARKFLETGDAGTKDRATGLSTKDYLARVTGKPNITSPEVIAQTQPEVKLTKEGLLSQGMSEISKLFNALGLEDENDSRSFGKFIGELSKSIVASKETKSEPSTVIGNVDNRTITQGSSGTPAVNIVPDPYDKDLIKHLADRVIYT